MAYGLAHQQIYGQHSSNNFILALGYKGDTMKDYFLNCHARQSDLTVHLINGQADYSSPTWNHVNGKSAR